MADGYDNQRCNRRIVWIKNFANVELGRVSVPELAIGAHLDEDRLLALESGKANFSLPEIFRIAEAPKLEPRGPMDRGSIEDCKKSVRDFVTSTKVELINF